MRKLDKLCGDNADIKLTVEDEHSKTYILPKKWLKIKPPRVLTEEQKASIAERLLSGRNNKG